MRELPILHALEREVDTIAVVVALRRRTDGHVEDLDRGTGPPPPDARRP